MVEPSKATILKGANSDWFLPVLSPPPSAQAEIDKDTKRATMIKKIDLVRCLLMGRIN
jgi:hypothetical protein